MYFIIILPIMPILIAFLLILGGVLAATAEVINTIITIAWVIVVLISAAIIIYNFYRKASLKNKIWSSIISIIAIIVAVVESNNFLSGLEASVTSGIFEFAFVFLFGGVVWLASAGMSLWGGFVCVDPDEWDDFRYIKAGAFIVGSLLLAGFFGLLG